MYALMTSSNTTAARALNPEEMVLEIKRLQLNEEHNLVIIMFVGKDMFLISFLFQKISFSQFEVEFHVLVHIIITV